MNDSIHILSDVLAVPFVSTDFSVSSKDDAGTRYECDCELVITNALIIIIVFIIHKYTLPQLV